MTNSSPPDPQNPLPESRRRPATGVTFDEMIAIVVAFSTVGAILFWALDGKKSQLANNFGLGEDNNLFFLGEDVAIETADPDVELFAQPESETDDLEIAGDLDPSESSTVLAPSSSEVVSPFSTLESESYGFDRAKRLAPLVGVTTLPGLRKESDLGRDIDPGIIDPTDSEVETPQATTPDSTADGEVETPQAPVPETPEMPDDVTPSYWAYPFVQQMNEKLTIAEFADDRNFEPDKLITRASMATLIAQAFDMKPETQNIKRFKDVTNQNATAADIDKAVRIGFMQGYSEDEFRPQENIPRYQVLVTLATGLDLEPSQDAEQILQQFDDTANIPDWAKTQVAAAIEAGLVVNAPGADSNSLSPNEPATRAEVAAMIHQALVETGELQPIESEYILQP